jgi:hypothetical protein
LISENVLRDHREAQMRRFVVALIVTAADRAAVSYAAPPM